MTGLLPIVEEVHIQPIRGARIKVLHVLLILIAMAADISHLQTAVDLPIGCNNRGVVFIITEVATIHRVPGRGVL